MAAAAVGAAARVLGRRGRGANGGRARREEVI
jgi:hypothetical protein